MLSRIRRGLSRRLLVYPGVGLFLCLFALAGLGGCDLLLPLLLTALVSIFLGPSGFQDTGQVRFHLQQADTQGLPIASSLNTLGLRTELDQQGGGTTECGFVDERSVSGSSDSSVVLFIDGSSTLEQSDSVTGDACSTCPHDPGKNRARAIDDFATSLLRDAPSSRVALLEFGPGHVAGDATTAARVLADFTSSAGEISSAAARLDGSNDADSPLWDGLALAVESLDATPRDGNRFIIVMSDGGDDGSSSHTLESVTQLAMERDATIHVIGLGPASSSERIATDAARLDAIRSLQKLAEATDGGYASAEFSTDLRGVFTDAASSITEGVQIVTYDCRDDQGKVPPTGSHITGRFLLNDSQLPFEFFSP